MVTRRPPGSRWPQIDSELNREKRGHFECSLVSNVQKGNRVQNGKWWRALDLKPLRRKFISDCTEKKRPLLAPIFRERGKRTLFLAILGLLVFAIVAPRIPLIGASGKECHDIHHGRWLVWHPWATLSRIDRGAAHPGLPSEQEEPPGRSCHDSSFVIDTIIVGALFCLNILIFRGQVYRGGGGRARQGVKILRD